MTAGKYFLYSWGTTFFLIKKIAQIMQQRKRWIPEVCLSNPTDDTNVWLHTEVIFSCLPLGSAGRLKL